MSPVDHGDTGAMQPARTSHVRPPGSRWSGRGAALGIGVTVILIVGIAPAHAGGKAESRQGERTLGRVTSAVRSHTSAPRARPGGDAPADRGRTGGYYHDTYPCATCPPYAGSAGSGGSGGWSRGTAAPPQLTVSLRVQAVEGSDGAVSGAVRLRSAGMALALEGAQYFERGRALDGSGLVRMDVWSLVAAGRVMRLGESELWLQGGLGGSGSSEFERMMGLVAGGALAYPVGSSMMLRGGARYYVLEQETQAGEAYADFGVSFLSIGYRVLRFNVGPALHGPQFGLHWQL